MEAFVAKFKEVKEKRPDIRWVKTAPIRGYTPTHVYCPLTFVACDVANIYLPTSCPDRAAEILRISAEDKLAVMVVADGLGARTKKEVWFKEKLEKILSY